MIRVLVVEDSAVTREYLVHLLQADGDITVIGTACDGTEAVQQAERLHPDVILMDACMPRMDGYEATREMMMRTPTRIIIISGSFERSDVNTTFAALEAGALAMLAKPRGLDDPGRDCDAREIIQTVKLMAEIKVIRRWARPAQENMAIAPRAPAAAHHRSVRLIAIGASTGGPPAVAEVLRQIPKRVAVLVVQHIAAGFTDGLARWLSLETGFPAKLAEHNERIRAGSLYVAPDGLHMGVSKQSRVRLGNEPHDDGFRPSISYLFHSVAEAYGGYAAGVLLSGMGRDGAAGLHALRVAGAATFAQNEASCVVFGMPQEAIRLGAAEYVLSPTEIGRTLRSLLIEEEEMP